MSKGTLSFSLPWKVLLVAVFLTHASGYPTGLSIDGACNVLMPQHGANAQDSSPPYQISFNPATYTPGTTTTVAVTISTFPGKQVSFRGFMLQARDAETSSADPSARRGTWDTSASNTQNSCSGGAAVHTNNDDKNSITINWNVGAITGHIVFRATFVQTKEVFWADVVSATLQDTTLPYDPASVVPATVVGGDSNSGTGTSNLVSKDSNCGSTIGCFSSCDGESCTFTTSWRQDGDDGIYRLSAGISSRGGYIALGFSTDDSMGGESVIGCVADTNTVVKVTSMNGGESSTPYSDPDVQLTSSNFDNGVLTCELRLPVAPTSNRKDLTKLWTLQFVTGPGSPGSSASLPNIGFHGESYYVSSEQASASTIIDSGAKDLDRPLIKAHGALMIIAWIFAASIGTVAARFYKPVWTGSLCDQKVWFQIHRTAMILVFLATTVGFVLIFVEVEEWSDIHESRSFLEGHPIIGVIVMALTVINPIMALFRPHPGTKNRPIFNWLHFFVGTAAHILGVIAIFFGVELMKADCPDYLKYILAGYVAWQLFIEILLSLLGCMCSKKARGEAYEMNGSGDVAKSGGDVDGAAGLKKAIFFLHVFAVFAFTVVVIVFIAIGKEELEEHGAA